MNDELRRFFARIVPIGGEDVSWSNGAMRLRVEAYLTTRLPPSSYVTSARAILVADRGCAVLRNADGVHVLPGGRLQADESIEAALRREILEETGCSISWSQPLGVLHFHHVTAKPPDYPYPYPDFVHVVFAVRGVPDDGFGGDLDGYETSLEFVSPPQLDRIALPQYQRHLVAAALALLGQ
jgi:8-oxo-dGTP pyrophosphatase MutT (NUDIX family)